MLLDNKNSGYVGDELKKHPFEGNKLSDFAACLDYSVANKDLPIGKLAAYRLHGESRLENDNFVYVDSIYAARS